MPKISIVFGVLLLIVGLAGFLLTGSQHPTALIPAILGLLLSIAGGVAMIEGMKMHAMHAAVLVGLLGFLGTLDGYLGVIKLVTGGEARPATVLSKVITSILCGVFVFLCVQSFIAARKARKAAGLTDIGTDGVNT